MATGERIRFIRNLRGQTQRFLGIQSGFSEKTADIRIAQYESGTREPKEEILNSISNALGVSPMALKVPDIDSEIGLMHTLFAIEDLYGLRIDTLNDEIVLRIDKNRGMTTVSLFNMFYSWAEQAKKYRNGEITRDDYDDWRYNYPEYDEGNKWVKMPSKNLMDKLSEDMGKK